MVHIQHGAGNGMMRWRDYILDEFEQDETIERLDYDLGNAILPLIRRRYCSVRDERSVLERSL